MPIDFSIFRVSELTPGSDLVGRVKTDEIRDKAAEATAADKVVVFALANPAPSDRRVELAYFPDDKRGAVHIDGRTTWLEAESLEDLAAKFNAAEGEPKPEPAAARKGKPKKEQAPAKESAETAEPVAASN